MTVVDRFLQYVKFDTQSDELTNLTPSTPGQMIFAQHLEQELRAMGLEDISLDENGYLMATLPANTDRKDVPTVGFIAHLDTSPRHERTPCESPHCGEIRRRRYYPQRRIRYQT